MWPTSFFGGCLLQLLDPQSLLLQLLTEVLHLLLVGLRKPPRAERILGLGANPKP